MQCFISQAIQRLVLWECRSLENGIKLKLEADILYYRNKISKQRMKGISNETCWRPVRPPRSSNMQNADLNCEFEQPNEQRTVIRAQPISGTRLARPTSSARDLQVERPARLSDFGRIQVFQGPKSAVSIDGFSREILVGCCILLHLSLQNPFLKKWCRIKWPFWLIWLLLTWFSQMFTGPAVIGGWSRSMVLWLAHLGSQLLATQSLTFI